ncbi:MAG TPA: DUF6531 domain-containing protein [Parafilimonas sp.]|nr:DUF6531 domain-containing protein [Parafilimonas sp.]
MAAAKDSESYKGAKEDYNQAKDSVNKAENTFKDLLAGKANIVDAAMAAKGAFDAVKGLSGKISASVMMPVMKALGAFKGQATMPAAKQMDPVMGIDVHMVTIPPSPAPVPLPHPYIGMLFNTRDWVSCLVNTFKKDALDALPDAKEDESGIGNSLAKNKEAIAGIVMGEFNLAASVKFGPVIPRAVTGTPVKSIPHIPFGAGWYPANDAAVAKNIGKAFLGSLFVAADGDPMVGSFHLNYDCWDVGVIDLFKGQRKTTKNAPADGDPKAELFVPSGTVLPIPIGRPVLVNSIPTPVNPLAILDKLFKAGLKKLKAAGRKAVEKGLTALRGKVDCATLTAISKVAGTGQSHPVDVSGGYFYTDNEDFKLPGPIPFSWERVWYSNSNYNGPLGRGWHHSYDMALAIDDESQKAILRMKDGRVAIFDIPTLEKETYNRSEKLTLYLHEEGYYYVSDVKSLLYRFTNKIYKSRINNTETFLLQSIANRNGFAIRFFYNEAGVLNKIIDSSNRTITVNTNSEGRIINVQLPDPTFNGRTTFAATTYNYTDDGYMVRQSDALNQAMYYEYENNLMVKEIWRNGCVWQFRYGKEKDYDAKCIEVWGTGNLLHYKFDYTDPTCTIATNSRGFKKKFYHKNGVVIKYVDPLDAEWEYRYNQYNELEWETDPLGNQKVNTYDDWGNITSITQANGSFRQATYGSGFLKHHVVEFIDRMGGKWNWQYDLFGNIIKLVNPLKAITAYKYDDGLVKVVINAKGIKTLFEYDNFYNLTQIEFSNGYKSKWTYDELGNCIRSSDSLRNERKVKFNILSLPEMIEEPDRNIKHLKFDAEGNIIYVKDNDYDIRFKYDFLNRLVERTQSGHSIRLFHNTEGILSKIVNEHDEVYSFETDANDKIIKEVGFDGLTHNYIRDSAGKVIRVNRPNNKFTDYEYDEVGRITYIRYYDSTSKKFNYANNGFLSEAENDSCKIIFERDILGRPEKELVNEHFISYEYDVLSNQKSIKSSLGADIQNDFDDFNNVVNINGGLWQSFLSYNELGFEIERFLPGGISCKSVRDSLGRLQKQNISKHDINTHNRQYTWGVNNRLKKITDTINGITEFFHDDEGNLTKTIFSNGEEQLRNVDAVGNLFTTINRLDRTYGKGGKLLKSKDWYYEYDDEGNLTSKYKKSQGNDKECRWKYVWNADGTLRCVHRPDGDIVHFTYDALGRRLSKKYKNTITKWLWAGHKPLHEWKEHLHCDKPISSNFIKEDEITTWIFNENDFTPLAKLKGGKSYSIIADHLGTPFQVYNDKGEKIWETQLDSYGKTRILKGDEGTCLFRYQGQYEDKETGLYYNRFRYYDPDSGYYISQDPIRLRSRQILLYAYVDDPNIYIDVFGLEGTSGTCPYPVGSIHPDWKGPVDYSDLEHDPELRGKDKDFTKSQKEKIYDANKEANGGYLCSDKDGTILEAPKKSQSGESPSPYEAQVDHKKPRSKGGTNDYSNAAVLSREQNRAKSDKT